MSPSCDAFNLTRKVTNMRIAFFVDKFPSLSETFILSQITGLIDRGYSVDIYADRPPRGIKMHAEVERYGLLHRTHYRPRMPQSRVFRAVKALGLLLANWSKNRGSLLRSLNFLKYGKKAGSLKLLYWAIPLLNKGPYDIIHCHFGPNGLMAVLLRDIGVLQGKMITTFHGFDVNKYAIRTVQDVYRSLFGKGDLYTANTTFTANKVVALGCPPDKLVKLPVGLDMSKFTFQPRKPFPGEAIRIITVARLVEKKGIEYSIRAAAKVAKEYPNLKYQIVGDGYLRQSLEDLIAELGVEDKVELLGWKTQDEVRKLYKEAHIFVLSSVTASNGDQEGQGLVLQEAQAMGLPVLSTLHNGIPDGVLDGKSGFLVPERDVNALAEKMSYLIEHPEIWGEMGRAGRVHVEDHYNCDKLNDRLVEIYRELTDLDLRHPHSNDTVLNKSRL